MSHITLSPGHVVQLEHYFRELWSDRTYNPDSEPGRFSVGDFPHGRGTAHWTINHGIHAVNFDNRVLENYPAATRPMNLLKSILRHELCHARWTIRDFPELKEVLQDNDIPQLLWNAFEDARVEHLWRRTYRQNFGWLAHHKPLIQDPYLEAPLAWFMACVAAEGRMKAVYRFAGAQQGKSLPDLKLIHKFWKRAVAAKGSLELVPVLLDWMKAFPNPPEPEMMIIMVHVEPLQAPDPSVPDTGAPTVQPPIDDHAPQPGVGPGIGGTYAPPSEPLRKKPRLPYAPPSRFCPGANAPLREAPQMAAILRSRLLAISRRRIRRNLPAGDLDFDRLADLAQRRDLDRVFMETRRGVTKRVAVQVYLDVSASMNYSGKIGAGAAACHILGRALELARIPFQILYYGVDSQLAKDWRDRLRKARLADASASDGYTYLPECLNQGVDALANRPEERKVIFVICDDDIGTLPRYRSQLLSHPHIERYLFSVGCAPNFRPMFDGAVQNLSAKNLVSALIKGVQEILA